MFTGCSKFQSVVTNLLFSNSRPGRAVLFLEPRVTQVTLSRGQSSGRPSALGLLGLELTGAVPRLVLSRLAGRATTRGDERRHDGVLTRHVAAPHIVLLRSLSEYFRYSSSRSIHTPPEEVDGITCSLVRCSTKSGHCKNLVIASATLLSLAT